MPTCTIVVCTYSDDRIADLNKCLDAVQTQSHRPEQILVVVDHNQGLLERLAGRQTITAIANASTQGLSGARNTGVQQATSEIVVFLDDDAVPEPSWLHELLAPFTAPTVAAVGGNIQPAWPDLRPWWFPTHLDWTVGCSIPTVPENGGEIRNVFGASAAFRRAALVLAGGFPTELGRLGANGAGCEETDVCIRIRQQTPTSVIVYAAKSTVHHRVTDQRATVGYVLRRCFAEGTSKARLARRVGSSAATGDERAYALTIARAVLGDVVGGLVHPSRIGRAAVLISGLGCASAGYLREVVAGRPTALTP